MPAAEIGEIIRWVHERYPLPWHRDALRRALRDTEPRDDDVAELVSAVRSAAGLGERVACPEDAAPVTPSPNTAPASEVLLGSVHSLLHVNALAQGQTIRFALKGVTAIYGENGAGKTGYSRLLRHACRPWRQKELEAIRPDVRSETPGTPEGSFELLVSGKKRSVTWKQGAAAPPELASFAVFDSESARCIVAEENTVAYQPESLRILPRFADLLKKVEGRVLAEVSTLETIPAALGRVQRVGAVNAFLAGLNAATTTHDLARVVPDPGAAKARLAEVTVGLAQLGGKDGPEAQARARDALRVRCEKVRADIEQVSGLVDDAAVRALDAAFDDLDEKRRAAAVASKDTFVTGEYLPGTGGGEWKLLYEAARDFAIHAAPGKDFPDVSDDAVCVWCQRPLTEDARQRMDRFREYVSDRAAKELHGSQTKWNAAVQVVAAVEVPDIPEDLRGALQETAGKAASELADLRDCIARRRTALLSGADKPSSRELQPAGSMAVLASVEALERQLAAEAAEKRALVDPTKRAVLASEKEDLEAKLALWAARDDVAAFTRSLASAKALRGALGACDTRPATTENGRLAAQTVTEALASAIRRELTGLGAASHLEVQLKTRGDHAHSLNQLVLAGTKISKNALLGVLSEGEQRVVAVAAFLAELSLAASKVGVIFDDPVSSLDHRWSDRCAERIVQLAADRQVIVFTHNIAFFMALYDYATEKQVPMERAYVARLGGVPGHCTGQFWETMDLGARLAFIRQRLSALDAAYEKGATTDDYRAQVGYAYDLLRACWERAVEEELFAKAIMRFQKQVKTDRLSAAVISDELCKLVWDGMTRTSNETPAHDRATWKPVTDRTPADVRRELEMLVAFATEVKKARTAAKKVREGWREPPAAALIAAG